MLSQGPQFQNQPVAGGTMADVSRGSRTMEARELLPKIL